MAKTTRRPLYLAGIISVLTATLLALTGSARATVAHRVGAAPTDRALSLELPLKIDSAGLARFATAVSTPGSPRYGQYRSIDQLARRFGASSRERTTVVRFLRTHGASGVRVDRTGLFAEATMRVGSAQRLFGTELARYATASRAHAASTQFISPAGRARVPAGLAGSVTGVVGLDTRPLTAQHPAAASARAVARAGATVPADPSWHRDATQPTSAYTSRTGTASGCPAALAGSGFTPNQYLTAYGFSPLQAAGLAGQGQRVALIEIDGFKTSDVKAFDKCYGLATPKINAFGVGIKKALAPGSESTLDLELLNAAAPGLKSIDVYESQPIASDVLKSLTDPLQNKGHTANVISASLGSCERATQASIGQAGINSVESALQLAAAAGISVLASSGDSGSTACLTKRGQPLNLLAVSFPSSSPWVTGIGGTNIKLDAANAIEDPAADQIVWNDEPVGLGAGGGGLSLFDRPAYQKGFVTASHREVPDLSLLADPLPGYEIYCTAKPDCGTKAWQHPGGTSAGAPLLAGGFALVDQQLHSRGQQALGAANALLYKLARTPATAPVFADVSVGSNDVSQAVFGRALGCCSAATGYDQASGLGSVNIAAFASAAAATAPKQATVSVSLPKQSAPVAAKHFTATVGCTETCLMGAYVRIQVGGSARATTLYSQIYELGVGKQRTIPIGLDAKLRTSLKAALDKHQRVSATIYGAIVDPSGSVLRRSTGLALPVRG